MKKQFLFSLMLVTALTATSSSAQILSECTYTAEQEIIRRARSYEDLVALEGKDLNAVHSCGGTILQLAALRGNAEVLTTLYQDKMVDFNTDVSIKDYPIPGAPETIPMILFAGRYSPNQESFQAFLNAGLDPYVKDSLGHDLKWYLARNPVMHFSDYTEYPPEVAWNNLLVE